MSGPSQPKVEGEQWSDERIGGFLLLKPQGAIHPDYYVLHQAYQHMTADFFARFIAQFCAAQRNINATSLDGDTLLAHIRQHKKAEPYIKVLMKNGAQ